MSVYLLRFFKDVTAFTLLELIRGVFFINIQDYLLIPRILESIVFCALIFLVSGQYRGVQFRNRPLVHKLFLLGISGWFIYSFLDIFIFSYGALSFIPSIPGNEVGYNIDYPSLFLANILRDIAIAGCFLEGGCYFLVPFAIYYGEKKVQQYEHRHLFLTGYTFLAFWVIITDQIQVLVQNENVMITAIMNEGVAIGVTIFLVMYFSAAYLLQKILFQALKEPQSQLDPLRIKRFSSGIFLMGFSYLWWVIVNNFIIQFQGFENLTVFLFASYTLHAFWMSSGILIYLGLKKANNHKKVPIKN